MACLESGDFQPMTNGHLDGLQFEDTVGFERAASRLLVDFCDNVDDGEAVKNVEQFLPNGRLRLFGDRFTQDPVRDVFGEDQLRQLFADLDSRSDPATRHVLSNVRLDLVNSESALSRSLLVVYHINRESIAKQLVPHAIINCDDRLAKDRKGSWRFVDRSLRTIS